MLTWSFNWFAFLCGVLQLAGIYGLILSLFERARRWLYYLRQSWKIKREAARQRRQHPNAQTASDVMQITWTATLEQRVRGLEEQGAYRPGVIISIVLVALGTLLPAFLRT